MKKVLGVEEVGKYLGLPVATIRKLLREKRLPGVKIGRQWRVRPEDLEEFFNKQLRGDQK